MRVLELLGRLDEAEPLLSELYGRASQAPFSPAVAALHMAPYGVCLVKLARYEQAEAPLREAYKRLKDAGQDGHERTREVVWALAEVCDHTNRPEEAALWRAELEMLHAASEEASGARRPCRFRDDFARIGLRVDQPDFVVSFHHRAVRLSPGPAISGGGQ